MAQMDSTHRRYDVDWLRTSAFFILILYHVGMYYVQDWGWHIKSDVTFGWLQEVMILTNPWRMSLLFFISAVALSLVLQRYPAMALLKVRTIRLLLPLVFGMFVVVAPQVYIEALDQELIEPGFWSFWWQYIDPNTQLLAEHHSIIGLLTWNHLWFIPYLWVYSVIVIAVHPLLNSVASSGLAKLPWSMMFAILCALLVAFWWSLAASFPVTHALLDDWYNHSKYALVFVAGYLFARNLDWWNFVIRQRRAFLLIAVLGYSFIVADRNGLMPQLAQQFDRSLSVQMLYGALLSGNHWGWIFAVVGYAGFYLNRPSRFLVYANRAILPWYILHQTLIVVVAWNLRDLPVPTSLESVIIILATGLGCLFGYEIVHRSWVLSKLFGLKSTIHSDSRQTIFHRHKAEV